MSVDSRGARLRDRFFALRAAASSPGNAGTAAALRAEVDTIDAPPVASVEGLAISFFPTSRFKQLRLIDASEVDASLRPLFARPSAELSHLIAVFVDPEELSYRSFENIIDLDRRFDGIARARLGFGAPARLADGVYQLSLNASARVRALLTGLDALDVYAPPLNPRSRGGRRFIFHSPQLGERLTQKLRQALPESLLEGLSHVNPVFRCNRFEPGDARFSTHIDSPYSDPCRGLVSKVSLLLYLTGGRGESVLRFGDDLSLDALDAMTAIVFAQDRPHDGGPFVDGPKIFLRTELVYRDANLEHSRSVARVFARACYLSTQSVFDPELERRADAAYDQAAAARWRMRAAAPEPEPMFRKRFRGVDFLANGYDYWFRRDAVTLPTAAAIAVLDVVNAKLGDRSFRSACRSRTLKVAPDEDMPAWIAARLKTTKRPDEPPFAGIHKPGLLPPLEQADKEDDQEIWGRESEYSLDTSDDWDPRRNRSLLWHLEKQRNRVEPIVSRAPILIMGQEVFLDPERFVIEGDKIHILSNEALAPVHFAGGIAYYDPSSFTRVVFTLDAPVLLVPPITFREHGDTLHLTLDLFRNGWMVRYSRRELEIRRLIGPDEWPTEVD